MPTLSHFDFPLTVEDVFFAQGADGSVIQKRNHSLYNMTKRAIEEALPLIKPTVVYEILDVDKVQHQKIILRGGESISSDFIVSKLGAAHQIIFAVCTIGQKVEEQASKCMKENAAYGFAVDGVGTAAVGALTNLTCNYFADYAKTLNQTNSMHISPGLDEWPVNIGQSEIFNVLGNCQGHVTLTPSMQMIPLKTTSFVMGIGDNLISNGRACDYCSMYDRCYHRRYHNE